jgi:hypothetical protein
MKPNEPTPTPKKRGRKSLLSPQLQQKICALLAAGNTIKTVVDAVGISERVYFDWCERNPHFLQATTRARAKAKIKLVAIITDAAEKDPKHAEWLLERSWPDEYGRSVRHPEPHSQPPEPESRTLSDSELVEILAKLDQG